MARPAKHRETKENPYFRFFQPTTVRSLNMLETALCQTQEVTLFSDEIEALKLHNIDNLSQIDVAKKMQISQPTVARILKKAYSKMSKALLDGKAIRINTLEK